jgi:hypothetical protein
MGHVFARVAVLGFVCALIAGCGPGGPVDVSRPAPERAGAKDGGRAPDANNRTTNPTSVPAANGPVDVPVVPAPAPPASPDAGGPAPTPPMPDPTLTPPPPAPTPPTPQPPAAHAGRRRAPARAAASR